MFPAPATCRTHHGQWVCGHLYPVLAQFSVISQPSYRAPIARYDCVFLFDVLEHIEDTGPSVTSVARPLRVDGITLTRPPLGTSVLMALQRV